MAKVECYNCKRVTAVISPNFRCTLCNYPLHKYIESSEKQPEDKILKDIEQKDQEPSVTINIGSDVSVNDKSNLPPAKSSTNISISGDAVIPPAERFDKDRHQNLLADLRANLDRIKRKNEVLAVDKGQTVIKKENLNPEKKGKVVAGWLVVHTENKNPVTYELFEGDNLIGRPDGPHHLDIKIADDPYISRTHCSIKIQKDFLHRFRYDLVDPGPSTNGTYANGYERRLSKGIPLFMNDGDTIQVGETKLVFKNTNTSVNYKDAASHVLDNDYTKTVAIKLK